MGRRTGVVALAMAAVVALSAAAGCGESSTGSGSAGGGSAPAAMDGVAAGGSDTTSRELASGQGDFALLPKHGPADPGAVGPKVIKTARKGRDHRMRWATMLSAGTSAIALK